tara:strand:+ start:2490 stop:2966 length:477 start_codon:yes stop_codon:yes gene_type:complete
MNNLKNNWDLWYHSINDNNWKKDSYKKIFSINSLCDYEYIKQTFQQNHYQNGMFFCMKEDIFPNWEDPDNRNGGCLSFKIPSVKIIEEWNELLLECINESILSDNNDEINGISISPKKEFNIIKIWFKNSDFKYQDFLSSKEDSLIKLDNSLYKKHDV